MKHKQWTRYFESKDATYNLFCLPYAGGLAEFYLPWKKILPESIALCPLQLPGRSYRLLEARPEHINNLIDEICDVLVSCTDRPFAIFGHSLGGILAYEVAKKLLIPPQHLFISGADAPEFWGRKSYPAQMDDAVLLNLFHDNFSEEEKKLYLSAEYSWIVKVLCDDLLWCNQYKPTEHERCNIKTSIFGSKNDPLCSEQDLFAWSNYFNEVNFEIFANGGHFFLKNYASNLIHTISKNLCSYSPN
jgi:medium-chain acyl-[acyl-carrier-protein] hydrolase